jgi:hypothetical protein
MYIVWGRRWYLPILPCLGIVLFSISATVRPAADSRREFMLTQQQLVLTNGILVNQDLADFSHLANAIKQATAFKRYVTICYCISLAVSGYATCASLDIPNPQSFR